MSLTRTQIEGWARWWFNNEYSTRLADAKLPASVLLEMIDQVQRTISRSACLIPHCDHWKVTAGVAMYRIEDYPDLYIRPDRRDPVFYDNEPLEFRPVQVLERVREDYLEGSTLMQGTPEYAAVRQVGRYIHLLLLPAPDTTAGDTTYANDPLRFFYYRLPKSLASTEGYPEISPDLHDLLKKGTQAKVAERLGDPNAGSWQAMFEAELAKESKHGGERNPERPMIRNRWHNATLGRSIL